MMPPAAPPAAPVALAEGAGPRSAGFAAGACATFAPTAADRGRTVFVDPGHGGPDPGAVTRVGSGSSLKEGVATLAVGLELARQLRGAGYRVVMSRTRDTSVASVDAAELRGGALSPSGVRQDLLARVRCANSSNASAVLSIHFNGHPDGSVAGTQTIYDGSRPFSAESRRLAERVHAALLAELRLADRGVVTEDALDAPTLSQRGEDYGHLVLLGPAQPGWVDEPTTSPGVLVEPLFLTAPAEAALAGSANGQRRIASALAAGVKGYLAGPPPP